MRTRLLIAAVLMQCTFGANLCQEYQDRLNVIKTKKGDDRALEVHRLVSPGQNGSCLVQTILATLRQNHLFDALKKFEQIRTDTQAGASAGGGGTTSIVSKGVAAKALSVAAEYGAVTESVSGQVVTVKGSLDGIPTALIEKGVVYYCVPGVNSKDCVHRNMIDFLRRFSYGVSFNTSTNQTLTATPSSGTMSSSTAMSSATAQPVTFTASRNQISSITGQVVLWNNRDANSADFQKQWTNNLDPTKNAALGTATDAALNAFKPVMDDIYGTPGYSAWATTAQTALVNASNDNLEKVWQEQFENLADILRADPKFANLASAYSLALAQYAFQQDALVDTLAEKPVATLQYTDNRPPGEDSHSTFRFVFDKGLGPKWTLTANLAVDIYDSPQFTPGVGRLRDVQVGAEIDRTLPVLPVLGAATLSGAYYFQDQKSPVLMVDSSQPLPGITFTGLPSGATQVLAQTGDIHIAQLKLTLGSGSSVRFPLAVTWSNRSELVPKPDWRAQVGISYDFDSLFAKQ
jgi:hypothetical protein